MHPKSETELAATARYFIRRQGDDIDAARDDYSNEARLCYAAIDDGNWAAYAKRADAIFVEVATQSEVAS